MGKNEDIRLQRLADDTFELVQILYYDTDVQRKPRYQTLWYGKGEGLDALTEFLTLVQHAIRTGGDIPVEMSQYDKRFVREGNR